MDGLGLAQEVEEVHHEAHWEAEVEARAGL